MNQNIPASGGQFGPAGGGQFEPARPGQFKSARGGQFHRRLQYMAGHKYVSSTERYRVLHNDDWQSELEKHHPMG